MTIRTFQAGDEAVQVSIYNEAAADLPKFKPATLDEVRRRYRSKHFQPTNHLFAEAAGMPVGYVNIQAGGRIGYPWCRKGHEDQTEPLFQAALQAMKGNGLKSAIAAYRNEWGRIKEFFLGQGFRQVREIVNFVMDLAEMPTPAARPATSIAPIQREDIPDILNLNPQVLRAKTVEELEEHLLHNNYFTPQEVFTVRGRNDSRVAAVGVLVSNQSFADPKTGDSNMPCFRLGAFGTEGLAVKRISGLFSFLARPDRDMNLLGLELMGQAASRLDTSDLVALAGQAPSDVPALVRFYQQYFRKQGSFPVFEREL